LSILRHAAPLLAFVLCFVAIAWAFARLVDRFPPMP
jgi:hypothetical protein